MYKIQKIPPLPNRDSLFLTGLNNVGQVVGDCYKSGYGLESGGIEHRAFFWMKEMAGQEEPMLLKAFSDAESFAYGINDHGQIIGHGALNGKSYGYLLTP